jgi:hypothetical protein
MSFLLHRVEKFTPTKMIICLFICLFVRVYVQLELKCNQTQFLTRDPVTRIPIVPCDDTCRQALQTIAEQHRKQAVETSAETNLWVVSFTPYKIVTKQFNVLIWLVFKQLQAISARATPSPCQARARNFQQQSWRNNQKGINVSWDHDSD